ncbi:B3 domain-containing protein LOC_Os12g40080-like [Silene latifolia]|uniref:B3 domain-containing protein LOC_Os12g40080-like n=1 Tax=Silene latifolia TaxID=37657 RepID=UPI003D77C89F
MAKYGNDLSDVVSLIFPTGNKWNVKLLKENGRAWFNDGWHEIVSYYSICPGHFLMFTYGGTSRFNVHIFDMSTCEIEYPLDSQEPREIQKTKAYHTVPTLSKENEMLALIKQFRRKFGVVTRKDIKKINSYQFENPSFAIVMHPSYVTDTGNKFRVRIPSKIAREYFTNTGGMSCTLQNATGDTWPVRCNGSSPKLMKISCGWKEFASDNKLRVNDICVFELIDADECLFKVEIIRHSSPASSVGLIVIPIKFMAKYGNDLSDVVSLKFPTGKTWKVKLLKENGRAWFNDGWHEIVTYYSICPGHFLMFTYGGTSRFNVLIFDMTTCEIEYPLDSHAPWEIQKTKANHTAPTSSKENGMHALGRRCRRKFSSATRKDINKINSHQFGNPSFAIRMHPTHVTHTRNNFRMQIPSKYAAEYFINAQGTGTLQNAAGDTWPIKYNSSSRPKVLKFSWGWKEFALDNKLCVNDICVFELINAVECLFKVEIIRHSSPASTSSVSVGVGVGVGGIFFMAVDDLPNNFPSFFKIILEPRHDLRKLAIPKKFMTEYGIELTDVVILKIPTGKTWEVELLKENGRTWFNDGWNKVVKFCSICHGHFLMFTYEGKSRFNVYIFDMTACEIEYPLDRHETSEVRKRVISKNRTMISRKGGLFTRKDIKKVNSYRFKNPSFAIVLHPTHVTPTLNYFRLQIPSNFAAEYLTNAQGYGTLENATGDTWPIRCVRSTLKRMILTWGWKEFVVDNKLRVRDICVFELINAVECLFKVEIIRHSSPASSVDVCVAGPSM